MNEYEETIYCGSATQHSNRLIVSIILKNGILDIRKHLKDENLELRVVKKVQPDKWGKTHFVCINDRYNNLKQDRVSDDNIAKVIKDDANNFIFVINFKSLREYNYIHRGVIRCKFDILCNKEGEYRLFKFNKALNEVQRQFLGIKITNNFFDENV